MELMKPLPTLSQVGFPRRWILRLWDLCAGGSLRNALGATPVREQGKQDWTEERIELRCNHNRSSQLVPWEALKLGWPLRVVMNQGKWTGPLYVPSSPLHLQPIIRCILHLERACNLPGGSNHQLKEVPGERLSCELSAGNTSSSWGN